MLKMALSEIAAFELQLDSVAPDLLHSFKFEPPDEVTISIYWTQLEKLDKLLSTKLRLPVSSATVYVHMILSGEKEYSGPNSFTTTNTQVKNWIFINGGTEIFNVKFFCPSIQTLNLILIRGRLIPTKQDLPKLLIQIGDTITQYRIITSGRGETVSIDDIEPNFLQHV